MATEQNIVAASTPFNTGSVLGEHAMRIVLHYDQNNQLVSHVQNVDADGKPIAGYFWGAYAMTRNIAYGLWLFMKHCAYHDALVDTDYETHYFADDAVRDVFLRLLEMRRVHGLNTIFMQEVFYQEYKDGSRGCITPKVVLELVDTIAVSVAALHREVAA